MGKDSKPNLVEQVREYEKGLKSAQGRIEYLIESLRENAEINKQKHMEGELPPSVHSGANAVIEILNDHLSFNGTKDQTYFEKVEKKLNEVIAEIRDKKETVKSKFSNQLNPYATSKFCQGSWEEAHRFDNKWYTSIKADKNPSPKPQ